MLLSGASALINGQTTTKVITAPKTPRPPPPKVARSPQAGTANVRSSRATNAEGVGSSRSNTSRPAAGARSPNGGSILNPVGNGASRNSAKPTPGRSEHYAIHPGKTNSSTLAGRYDERAIAGKVSPLPAPGSRASLQKLNEMRSRFTGLNHSPLPQGQIIAHPNGNHTVSTADGRLYKLRGDGTLSSFRSSDLSARFFASGQVASLHTRSIDIRAGPRGERTVIWRRPDRSVVVGTGPHSGYLEKTVILRGNREMIQRTYVSNGVVFTRTYTVYSVNGLLLPHYMPEVYFAPGMYGWVYYPWRPVTFDFGVGNPPWYAANRSYFNPSPSYTSGYSWLADFELSTALAMSFDQQFPEVSPAASGFTEALPPNHIAADVDTPITLTLKDAIAEEIRQQLRAENAPSSGHMIAAESAAPIGNTTAPGNDDSDPTKLPAALQIDHVFVVSSPLEVEADEDQMCSLTGGDVLQLAAPPAADAKMAKARVASSRRSDCPAGEIVAVSLLDLQEMQNDLRAGIDAGLRALHDNQGRDGWPAAPAAALAPARPAIAELPPADPQVWVLLGALRREAEQAEAGLKSSAFADR